MSKFFVSMNGSSDGDGSILNPWRYIKPRLLQMRPGDTLFCRSGIYNENQISFGASGVSGAPITLTAYEDELAKVIGTPWKNTVNMHHALCALEKLELEGGGIAVDIEADDCSVRSIVAHGTHSDAIVKIKGNDNLVEASELYDAYKRGYKEDACGVLIHWGANNTVKDNKIYDCRGDCVHVLNDSGAGGTQILNNQFYFVNVRPECGENGFDSKDGDAKNPIILRGNTFRGFRRCDETCGGSGGMGAAATFHRDAQNILVEHNVFMIVHTG